jgi:hypothetical protein
LLSRTSFAAPKVSAIEYVPRINIVAIVFMLEITRNWSVAMQCFADASSANPPNLTTGQKNFAPLSFGTRYSTMIQQARFVVVLTATITPLKGAQIARTNPDERKRDYMTGFRFWVQNRDPRLSRILFVENSGASLLDFRQEAESAADKDIEFVSVPPISLPSGLHYGYAEMQMLDYALSRSRHRSITTHMIKATGRLQFPKISALLDRLPSEFDIAVDTCQALPFGLRPQAFVQTQLFLASHSFYGAFLQHSYHDLRPDYPFYIEHLIYERLKKMSENPRILTRWPISVEPMGVAGYSGKRYDRLSRCVLTTLRAALRKPIPDFWL